MQTIIAGKGSQVLFISKYEYINVTKTKKFIDSRLKSLYPQIDTGYTCQIGYCGQAGSQVNNNVIVVQNFKTL